MLALNAIVVPMRLYDRRYHTRLRLVLLPVSKQQLKLLRVRTGQVCRLARVLLHVEQLTKRLLGDPLAMLTSHSPDPVGTGTKTAFHLP